MSVSGTNIPPYGPKWPCWSGKDSRSSRGRSLISTAGARKGKVAPKIFLFLFHEFPPINSDINQTAATPTSTQNIQRWILFVGSFDLALHLPLAYRQLSVSGGLLNDGPVWFVFVVACSAGSSIA